MKIAFIQAFNTILGDKERYIHQFEELLPILADSSELEQSLELLQEEHESIDIDIHRFVEANAQQIQNQTEYEQRFREMSKSYQDTKRQIAKTKDEIVERSARINH